MSVTPSVAAAQPAPALTCRHRKHAARVREVHTVERIVVFADGAVLPLDRWMDEPAA